MSKLDDLHFSRHSRTILSCGESTFSRIYQSNLLVIGLSPLGTEICKIMLLFGIQSITIIESSVISYSNLELNFYLPINSFSSDVIISNLKTINSNAEIKRFSSISEISLQNFSCVVSADSLDFENNCLLNDQCRLFNIPYLLIHSSGILFSDYGNNFSTFNISGKPPLRLKIQNISRSDPGTVTIIGYPINRLPKHMLVRFEGLSGMKELEQFEEIKYNIVHKIIEICDTSQFSSFDSQNPSGYMIEVKKSYQISHKPLRDANTSNFYQSMRRNKSKSQLDLFLNNQIKLEQFLPSIISTLAGIASHEIFKMITHSLCPMENQFFIYDHSFDFERVKLSKILQNQKILIIGVGAVGCEIAKLSLLSNVKKII
jgi:ubiquitin-activating enzyme E1